MSLGFHHFFALGIPIFPGNAKPSAIGLLPFANLAELGAHSDGESLLKIIPAPSPPSPFPRPQ